MKKNITILILALVVLGGVFYLLDGNKVKLPDADTIPQAPTPPPPPTLINQLINMTVTVPDLNIETKLNRGSSGFAIPDLPSGVGGSIAVGEVSEIYKENDLLAVLVVNSGGTGIFNYLTLFTRNNGQLEQQDNVFLGDRISVETITTQDGVVEGEYLVTVSYLDREEGEAMSAKPTIPTEKRFVIKDNAFEQAE